MKTIGNLTVLLILLILGSCTKDDDSTETTSSEESTISHYTDITFHITGGEGDIYFSSGTGKIYKKEEITSEIGATIDMRAYIDSWIFYFESPTDLELETIPNSISNKFKHYEVAMTPEEFDNIKDASAFDTISVVNDDESLPISSSKDAVILFENAKGKKGAIKIKSTNQAGLVTEIKVTK